MKLDSFSFIVAAMVPLAQATDIHVNQGCVTFENDLAMCNGKGSITAPNGVITIYAKFDSDDLLNAKVKAGCKLEAKWPKDYGAIYFGENNCLYDSRGFLIGGQCCTESTNDVVLNPYRAFYG